MDVDDGREVEELRDEEVAGFREIVLKGTEELREMEDTKEAEEIKEVEVGGFKEVEVLKGIAEMEAFKEPVVVTTVVVVVVVVVVDKNKLDELEDVTVAVNTVVVVVVVVVVDNSKSDEFEWTPLVRGTDVAGARLVCGVEGTADPEDDAGISVGRGAVDCVLGPELLDVGNETEPKVRLVKEEETETDTLDATVALEETTELELDSSEPELEGATVDDEVENGGFAVPLPLP